MTRESWQGAIDAALESFERNPWILQRFHKGKRVRQRYLDRERDEIREYDGRVRLCPYFFVTGEESVTLGGVLATIAPADKRLIHGMTDAVMTSSVLRGSD
ncbi:MAG: hypothetical protein JO324_09105 [Candidatus Eremiobacteraeota bacterium]|nr:hypothetical protein [Candidatus Eremiobacteraeota bacterium]